MSGISRRDFVNGTLMVAGSSLLSAKAGAQSAMAELDPSYYPPALTGLRGSHPGSNDHAHARVWAGTSDWGHVTDLAEHYDLVVVGAGISGLAAARFYQQRHGADKKILILDNHDDFGGHAKRNEHTIDGQLRISYGGSQTIVEPRHAHEVVTGLFEDIGVDTRRFETAYDIEFFRRHDLGGVTYFNKEIFGEDKVVRHPFCNYPNYVEGIQGARIPDEDAVSQAPLSARGKEQLLRVVKGGLHSIDVPAEDLQEYIESTNYFDYLKNTLGVDDEGVLRMARHSGLDWSSASTELLSIAAAKSCGALGFAPKAVYDEDNPYIHHFPDGNAGLARALVNRLVPDVAPGDTAEDLVLAEFDYSKLDRPSSPTRIRLNSTAVNVVHEGNPADAGEVAITYINDGQAFRVSADNVVMACYNVIIPYIVDGMPDEHSEALKQQGKSPLQYTTVGLRNWKAFKELGIGLAMSPGNMHQAVLMDFPVSMGGYEFVDSPDDPCVIQMIHCPYGTEGAPALEQFKEARYRMLSLTFDDYETEIRRHLTGMLPADLFDFDRDVASISVNRWAHGYTTGGPGDTTRIGRQPFGRITIANADSAPGADAKTAIMMGHRAVEELG